MPFGAIAGSTGPRQYLSQVALDCESSVLQDSDSLFGRLGSLLIGNVGFPVLDRLDNNLFEMPQPAPEELLAAKRIGSAVFKEGAP